MADTPRTDATPPLPAVRADRPARDVSARIPITEPSDPEPDVEASAAPSAAPLAPAPAGDDLEIARRQRDEYYDQLLRKAAEFDNYRKRTERERREMIERAAGDVIEELLPVIDDLERALEADAGADGTTAYRRGVEIIHKKLLDVLRRHGVRPIETVGAAFDPHVHQAVVHEASPAHRDGEIIEELRRGYTMGDRLLRPAMVKVAKG